MTRHFLALAATALLVCGCRTYVYRVVQPAGVPQSVSERPVIVHYAPLGYRLVREKDRLAMRIVNPTTDRLTLDGARSYVVDPEGESHPVHSHILGPNSFTWMLLPPLPLTFAYPEYSWGWGMGWGWRWGPYDPFWGPFYGPAVYGHSPVSYVQVVSRYDWTWKTGPIRLHLTYQSNTNAFDHEFEIVREPTK